MPEPRKNTVCSFTFMHFYSSCLFIILFVFIFEKLGKHNEILNSEERIGARVKYRKSVEFKECVEYYQLEDVKYRGNYCTWSNKQQGDDSIYSKIDRVLANQKWLDCYIEAEVFFLNEELFDHSPALLSVYQERNYGRKPFKYFRMWSHALDFKKNLANVWSRGIHGTAMFQLVYKLKQVKLMLKDLNNKDFHDIPSAEMRMRLNLQDSQEALKQDPLNKDLIQKEKEARAQWLDQPEQVQEAFLDFYEGLLATKMSDRRSVIKEIVMQGAVVMERQAQMLIADYIEEDVKQEIFSIPASKAPGPDGYSSSFFQDNWEIVGKEVSEAILSFLHSGKLLKEVNSTVLTLVPKSKCQNLDLVRHYGRKHTKANCMIKLDLRKAYDTIEWDFLEEMLAAFQFPRKFTNLIMQCVTTPKFSLMFNGSLHGFFSAKRGLR
ncbi:uncharacterized protein LOC133825254 [Humulus lupulus]|uniref:uncharacterized protein LOC133825254 n=1 Tax=Humulus lupulus TaxID=3486 RepID=UPI002B411357|nr:uncharacterized protein LOC133825254 [Humulus lupulus]